MDLGLGDEAVVAAEAADQGGEAWLLLGVEELGAVVGLPVGAAELNAVALEVLADGLGHEAGGGLGDLVGGAAEAEAADDLADGVLEAREPEVLHLGPVLGDVLKELGVGDEFTEQRPTAFDGPEATLGLRLGAPPSAQAMLADHAADGSEAGLQIEVLLQALDPEAGLLAQPHHPTLLPARGLMGTAPRPTAQLDQARGFARRVAPHPLARRVSRAAQQPRGGLEPALPRQAHELLPQQMSFRFHPICFKGFQAHRPSFPTAPLHGHLRRWPWSTFIPAWFTIFSFPKGVTMDLPVPIGALLSSCSRVGSDGRFAA